MVLRSRARPRSYQLGPRIAAGGMGEVYNAASADLNRDVAVKRMLDAVTSEDDLKLMFLREVAVAATLEHHNVVEVLDAGQNGLELFLVMEFVDGPALAEIVEVLRLQNKILPVEVSCHIVSSVALGLAHAHERCLPDGTPLGIVHRDVAPENVLISTDGVPKIVDFGLAKLSGHSLTQPGVVRGRPRSLSPEQARGDTTDVRSDIFSLGTMLFELCAGQPLYPNEALASLLWKVAAGDYGDIEPRLTHIDPGLVEIIKTAIAVNPEDRYRSAREMDRALDAFRAARGLRVSSRALAQVVTMTWPSVQGMRGERMEGQPGELEGAQLILPAEIVEEEAPVPPIPQAHVSSSDANPTPVRRREARNPLAAGLHSHSGTSGDIFPTPRLPPAAFTSELPKPRAPRHGQQQGEEAYRARTGWRLYVAAVILLAGLVFSLTWLAGTNTAPDQISTTTETTQVPVDS